MKSRLFLGVRPHFIPLVFITVVSLHHFQVRTIAHYLPGEVAMQEIQPTSSGLHLEDQLPTTDIQGQPRRPVLLQQCSRWEWITRLELNWDTRTRGQESQVSLVRATKPQERTLGPNVTQLCSRCGGHRHFSLLQTPPSAQACAQVSSALTLVRKDCGLSVAPELLT